MHARVRVVNKAGVSDHSEIESESEYSQVSDYYHDKLRLATTEQTNFTLGLQDAGLLRQQQEEEERLREEKVREERMRLEEDIRMSRASQRQETYQEYHEGQQYHQEQHRSHLEQQTSAHCKCYRFPHFLNGLSILNNFNFSNSEFWSSGYRSGCRSDHPSHFGESYSQYESQSGPKQL